MLARQIYISFILLYTGIICNTISAQTIFLETFDEIDGSTTGIANGVSWSSTCTTCIPAGDWWEVRLGVYEGTDTNGPASWETGNIDISNCTHLDINFDVESVGNMEACGTGCNSVDFVAFEYNIDNTGWVTPGNAYFCNGACASLAVILDDDVGQTNYSTGCFSVNGNNIQLRITVQTWAGSESWRIDNVAVICANPNAGTNGSLNTCPTGSIVDLISVLGGTPDIGGTWSGPSTLNNGDQGSFDPSTMLTGVYTYTVGSIPCQELATVTVTNSAINAGGNANITICSAGPIINLFDSLVGIADIGGVWTGPSTLSNGHLGTFDPTTAISGIYTYSIGSAPCDDSADIDITIITNGNAGNSANLSVCADNTSINLFSVLGGSPDLGGTWSGPSVLPNGDQGTFDPSISAAGMYTYTVGVLPCTTTATVTVSIQTLSNPGSNGNIIVCSGSNVNLFSSLGGTPDINGTWNGPSVLMNSYLGAFDPNTMLDGTYIYLVSGNVPCSDSTATVIVTTQTQANAFINPVPPICSNSNNIFLTSIDPGGTWSGPGIIDPISGEFNPSVAGSGNHIIQYDITGLCGDSQTTIITVLPQISGTSSLDTIICEGSTVNLTAHGIDGDGIYTYGWTDNFGNPLGNTNTITPSPSITTTYSVQINDGCGDQIILTITVSVEPIPVITFEVDNDSGCVDHTASFSSAMTNITNCLWDFGDGNSSVSCGPTSHIYSSSGCFSVTLSGDIGACSASLTIPSMVCVFDNAVADFSASPGTADFSNPYFEFTNLSSYADQYFWDFDDGSISQEIDANHYYNDITGAIQVCLMATNIAGCNSTYCDSVFILEDFSLYVPNTFTPDGNGLNDVFKPIITSADEDNYTFTIFDRWGHLMFQTSSIYEAWTGTYLDGGKAKSDTYIWMLDTTNKVTGKSVNKRGHISLLR